MLKINFKENINMLIIFALSMLIIILLFGLSALYMLPIAIILIFLLLYTIEIIESKKKEQIEKERTVNALKILYLELKNNNSTSKSIDNLFKKINNEGKFYNIIKKFEKQRQLGDIKKDNLIENINYIEEKSLIDTIYGAIYKDNISVLNNLYKKLNYEITLTKESNNNSLNKYLIVSMMFNSIIPSLLIFGFISYSIFSNFEKIIPTFSFILLIILPSMSILISKKISEINV